MSMFHHNFFSPERIVLAAHIVKVQKMLAFSGLIAVVTTSDIIYIEVIGSASSKVRCGASVNLSSQDQDKSVFTGAPKHMNIK